MKFSILPILLFAVLPLSAQWNTNGSVIYYNSGYVGIGVSNPIRSLQVGGSSIFMDMEITGTSYNLSDERPRIIHDNTNGGRMLGLLLTNDSQTKAEVKLWEGNTHNPYISFSTSPGNGSHMIERMRINSNGYIGIGTTTPDAKLDIEGNGELLRLTYSNSAGYVEAYKGGLAHWYVGAGSNGNDDVSFSNYRNASLNLITNGQYRLKILGNGNVGIGETNPTKKLVVNGVIGATEVKVSTTPNSDYVFEPDYDLLPLQKVESFIQQNKHLPDIPSAEEFKENGVGLGEMDNMLLRKIEELTLYVIELKKENEQLVNQNREQDRLLNSILNKQNYE